MEPEAENPVEASGSSSETSRKRKKGVSHVSEYAKNKIKIARVSGAEYTTSSGRSAPRRSAKGFCDVGCRYKCSSKLTLDDQNSEFVKFYSYETSIEQDVHLLGLIIKTDIVRQRPRANSQKSKPRAATFTYYLPTAASGNKQKVCKTTFLNTYDIKMGRIRRLQALMIADKVPKRKNLGNTHRSTPAEIVDKVKEHIKSFPTHVSHYSNRTYTYLDPRLTIKDMHTYFKTKYPRLNVTYGLYYAIFKQHFDLHFGRPQVDTCITCEQLNITIKNSHVSDSVKKQAELDLKVHKARANKFYSCIKNTKDLCQQRNDIVGLCFDYMQNLPLPHIPVQDVFYLRQLWVNVFLIHNLKTGQSVAYVYHEGIAKKGANDVCSMIHDYIQNYIPASVKNLRLFSDGCTGQNKNHTMVRYCAALVDTGRFNNVREYFPVRGHSFNPCDRVFGTIKRDLSKSDRIYVPMEYVEIITNSVNTIGRLEVQLLNDSEIFLDFKNWWPSYYSKTAVSEETKGRAVSRPQKIHFQPTAFKEFRHSVKRPGLVQAHEFINNPIKNTFKLRYAQRVRLPHKKAYEGVNPINSKKIQDINKLMSYIPDIHQDFYTKILAWPTTQADVDNEDD